MLVNRFLQNRNANVALSFAVAVIPLFASMGVAVDFIRGASVRAAMQGALDASVLAIAKNAVNTDSLQLNAISRNYFNTNFHKPEVANLQTHLTTSSTSSGYTASMSATGTIKTSLMGVVGFPTLNISARATAVAHIDGYGCVLSLNPHSSGAINGPGSATVNLNGCSLYDNSDNATALTVSGSAHVNAQSVGVVGGLTGASNITTINGIRTKIAPIDDPYADVSPPRSFGCTTQNFSANRTVTIDPGVYCGGMKINAGATVTLKPGIYYIDGGRLTVNGGAILTGERVTLIFTSKNRSGYATASINGNAVVNLTPPRVGATAGILMFGDRNMPTGTSFKFNGGATQYLGGAVYLPKAAVSFAGGLGANTSCTQLIADTVTFTGNSALAVNCDQYITRPFYSKVVRLIS